MNIVVQDFIRTGELAKRLGTTPKTIYLLVKEKHLTRLRDKTYPWPDVEYEWKTYQANRIRPQPLLKDKQAKEAALISSAMENSILPNAETIFENVSGNEVLVPEAQRKKDIETLSIGEQIIHALKAKVDGAETSAYHWSRALNESVKARTSMLAMLEAEGKTLKREEVETFIYSTSRMNRDLWLNWPQRIATEMGQLLGVDSRLLNDVLLKAVHENLERNATMPTSFEPDA